MARRAFVVGSQTAGLRGATGDARRMAAALEQHGFTVDLCVEGDATRAGILAGYRRLIEASGPDDAALFYYSGHGALVENPHYTPGSDLPEHYQCIIPVDIDETSEDDFRGIVAQELSLLLADLTERTRNVVVVLDCCHAKGTFRPSAWPKWLERPLRVSAATIKAYVDRMLAERRALLERLDPVGNPYAVRLLATRSKDLAWEYERRGERVGVMTESLLLALDEARGHEVTWKALGRRVRELVISMFPTQQPDVEGPARRILFERREVDSESPIPVVWDEINERCLLRAGLIHGVRMDDELAVLEAPVEVREPDLEIGTARVTRVATGESELSLTLRSGEQRPPEGACAFIVRSADARRILRVDASEEVRRQIAAALGEAPALHIEGGAAEGGTPVLATVEVHHGQVEVVHPSGERAHPALHLGVARAPAAPTLPAPVLDQLIAYLDRMAAAQTLRELRSMPTTGMPQDSINVEWGYVDGDRPVPLRPSGELLAIGTPVYIRIWNTHPGGRPIYVSIFDIGVSQKISLLTPGSFTGVEINPMDQYVFGRGQAYTIRGVKLGWPGDLPRDQPRVEELVIIATEQPHDLSPLANPGLRVTRSMGIRRLERIAWHFQTDAFRDLGTEDDGSDGFLVQHIDFLLSPRPAALRRDEGFLMDDRPPASMMAMALAPEPAEPAGATTRGLESTSRPPRRIAVLLTELIVHDTRTLFGSADIRVDALAITRLPPTAGAPYRAETRNFSGIRDDERLPLDNVLLYYGDVRDFVDLRLWVSRDREDAKTLSEMLQAELGSSEFQGAAGALLAVTAAAPHAGAIVAATGAAATLGKIAWKLLAQALPKTIGVYQTSLLAVDGFNVGRHPPKGLLRAQGFSLGYEVKAV